MAGNGLIDDSHGGSGGGFCLHILHRFSTFEGFVEVSDNLDGASHHNAENSEQRFHIFVFSAHGDVFDKGPHDDPHTRQHKLHLEIEDAIRR